MISLSLTTRKTSSGRIYYYAQAYDRTRTPTRKVIALKTTHKAVAEKRLRKLQSEIDGGAYDPWSERRPVLSLGELRDAFLDDAEKRGLRPKTISVYGAVTRQFMEHVGSSVTLDSITGQDVRAFCVQPHLSEHSRAHRLRHMKALFSYARRAGLLTHDPCQNLALSKPKRRTPKVIRPHEVERILLAIDYDLEAKRAFIHREHGSGVPLLAWLKPFILLTYYCGLRRGETIRLLWRDVDLEVGVLTVRGSKAGDRVIPLPDVAAEVLGEWRGFTGGGDGPVFPSEGGGFLNGDYVGKKFRTYAKLAGVPVTSLHGLRHGAATALIASGVPTSVVQQILGHSSVAVTEKYLHVAADLMRGEMNKAFAPRGNDQL